VFEPLVLQLHKRPVSDDLPIIRDSLSSKVVWVERGCHYFRLNDRTIAKNVHHIMVEWVPTDGKLGVRKPSRMQNFLALFEGLILIHILPTPEEHAAIFGFDKVMK
jgi:hypothetical protein